MANNYLLFSEMYTLPTAAGEFLGNMLAHIQTLSDHMAYDFVEEDFEQIVTECDSPITGPAGVAALLFVDDCQQNIDFNIEISPTGDDGTHCSVWVSTEESGTPELLVPLMQLVMRQFDLPNAFSLEFAFTCSKMRVGEFGGGAVVWTAWDERWMNTGTWTETTKGELLSQVAHAG